jgi:hypothetical protein
VHPRPQQAGRKIPLSLNVHEKVAITVPCGIWSKLLNPASAKLPKAEAFATIKEEKLVVLPSFVVINFTKLQIILFLNRYRKKFDQIDEDL